MGDSESDLRRFVRHLLQKSKLSGPIIPDQNVIDVATEPNDSVQPYPTAPKLLGWPAGKGLKWPSWLGGAAAAAAIRT